MHRLAVEEQRRREEAAYLAQFGESPPAAVTDSAVSGDLAGNVPGTVLPEANAPAADAAPADLEAIREELRRRGEQDKR